MHRDGGSLITFAAQHSFERTHFTTRALVLSSHQTFEGSAGSIVLHGATGTSDVLPASAPAPHYKTQTAYGHPAALSSLSVLPV
jgi:hypothetical protein